jgi:predicted DNA-binding transcriptional regulator YafY
MPRRPSSGRPAGQYTQAVRLFRLYQLLEASPEGVRLEEAARELGVTARSIRRDLKALEVAGVELEHVDLGTERRVRRTRSLKSTEPIKLTRFQRYSLAAVRRVFDVFTGTPLHDDFSQLFARLSPTDDEGAMVDRFLYIPEAPKNYRKLKDQIYEIYDGILRSLTLTFSYEGGTTPGTRKVEPYALVMYQNGLYVVGRDVQKNADRTFAVERMKRVRALTQSPFTRDPDFNVSKLFEGAFGIFGGGGERHHVVVDFSARLVPLVEPREWHPTQRVTRLEDGGVRIEFEVTSLTEVQGWVLRWGAGAVVRAPEVLRQRVRDEQRRALAAYDAPSEGAAVVAPSSA